MFDHSHNRHPRLRRLLASYLYSLADWILGRPVSLLEGFVDDGDRRARLVIMIVEISSRDQLCADGFKITRCDVALIRLRVLIWLKQWAVGRCGARAAIPTQWKSTRRSSG